MECNTTAFSFEEGSVYAYLQTIPDVRKRRGIRYHLSILLLLVILAKLGGQDTPYGIADWVKNRRVWLFEVLPLSYARLPHHSTYRRILEAYASELERVLTSFLGQLSEAQEYQVMVIDGKTLRGTITPAEPFGLHLLTAYVPELGIALKQ